MAITSLKLKHAVLVAIGVTRQWGRSSNEEPEEVAGISAVDSSIAICISRSSRLDDMPGPDVNRTGFVVHRRAAIDGQPPFDNGAHKICLHRLSRDGAKNNYITIDGPRHYPSEKTGGFRERHCSRE
jgi:hypothetical protein